MDQKKNVEIEMKTVEDFTNSQWEEFAKSTNVTVSEAQKQYQAFMVEYAQKRIKGVLIRSSALTLIREEGFLRSHTFEIDECANTDVEVFTVEACIKGFFDSFNDFRLKITYSISAFGQELKKETIEISSSDAEWCNKVGALGNYLKYCFGVRPHGNHGDVYLRGKVETWLGDIPFDLTLIHLG